MDKKAFGESDAFEGLELSSMAKEAFAVALEDILQEHTLAYIGYPEKGTMKDKAMRIIFGIGVLPMRLISTFSKSIISRIPFPKKPKEKESVVEKDQPIDNSTEGDSNT